jgi:hypothetical protein
MTHATPYRVTFYLGTHRAHWLADSNVPLFVSRRILEGRKTLPRASTNWVLDSGGFTELNLYGRWQTPLERYADEVLRYQEEIGGLDWAAPMDWMCEPSVVQKTGLSVSEHQRRTIDNFQQLRDRCGAIVAPVLQGWTVDDYLHHADMYQEAGIYLTYERIVGVGSICRRGQDRQIHQIIRRLAQEGINLHAFGVRSRALAGCADVLTSADSMSWSYTARRSQALPGHSHKSCANCREYAEQWHARQLARLESTLFYGAAA